MSLDDSFRTLILRALSGHGWATTGTIAATWRLRNRRQEIAKALGELVEAGEIVPCQAEGEDRSRSKGWVRPADLELVDRLRRVRPRRDRGVLLSPFDPVLWDRNRVARLFGFDQVLEIFKPASQRVYGYYCMPVLAGDRLVARVDLKCDRQSGRLIVLSCHYEAGPGPATFGNDQEATRTAVERYAESLGLLVTYAQPGGAGTKEVRHTARATPAPPGAVSG
jgi:uncharacterized protein YcaQ